MTCLPCRPVSWSTAGQVFWGTLQIAITETDVWPTPFHSSVCTKEPKTRLLGYIKTFKPLEYQLYLIKLKVSGTFAIAILAALHYSYLGKHGTRVTSNMVKLTIMKHEEALEKFQVKNVRGAKRGFAPLFGKWGEIAFLPPPASSAYVNVVLLYPDLLGPVFVVVLLLTVLPFAV